MRRLERGVWFEGCCRMPLRIPESAKIWECLPETCPYTRFISSPYTSGCLERILITSSASKRYTTVLPRERTVERRFCFESTPYSPKYWPSCMMLICSPSRLNTTAVPDSRKYMQSGSPSITQISLPFSNWRRCSFPLISSISCRSSSPLPIWKKSCINLSSIRF